MERMQQTVLNPMAEVAARIKELREISGYSTAVMAQLTDLTEEKYLSYEQALEDLPFSFLHKCALTFKVEMSDLMEGRSPQLSSYTITRKGAGEVTAQEKGIDIRNLAPRFRKKIAEPYFVRYSFDPALQDKPIDAKAFYKEWKQYHRRHLDEANAEVFVTEAEIFDAIDYISL